MKPIEKNQKLIAFCGLYCGACRAYLKGKCKGCAENSKATWCNIRKCCIDARIKSCAECKKNGTSACKDFNNMISKIIQFVSRTSREKCIEMIKKTDYEKFAAYMAEEGIMSIKKCNKE